MGRKKRTPTAIITMREKAYIKRKVQEEAKRVNITIQNAYKKLLREGKI